MKKCLLIALLLLQYCVLYSQTYDWGAWVQNPCFKGIYSRCKVRDYNDAAKQYTWDIEIKNAYSQKVSFSFDIANSSIDGRISVNPGSIDKNWTLNPSNTVLKIECSKVCFDPNDYCSVNANGVQNKSYRCYAVCDNGIPNVPQLCGNISDDRKQGSSTGSDNPAAKAQQEKPDQYNSFMASARKAMQDEEYTAALQHYNSAKTYASDQYETNAADQGIAAAQKAIKDKERRQRLKKQAETDRKEDAAYTAAAAGVSGLLLLLTDHYSPRGGYFRLQTGLGLESIPVITSTAAKLTTQEERATYPTLLIGMKFGFLNRKPVSLHFNPQVSYGINAFSTGISGVDVGYGGTASLQFSTNRKAVLKGVLEAGYWSHAGAYTYDAAAAAGGTATTDEVRKSEYTYSMYHYGGGFMLHFINGRKARESWIRPTINLATITQKNGSTAQATFYSLQVNICSAILLEGSYSSDFPALGDVTYPYAYTKDNLKGYWLFRLVRQGIF